eukprot:TRINITY_DN10800_c0_g2_i1.p1 TRINITY_DN10800_c0_g2~~TRINITY_DN10800_c0_g2_i1.p1  ORF type:complete len:498 (-),score=93.33 TRINITY_DN10800_c0_g2_i1:63-1556(-)
MSCRLGCAAALLLAVFAGSEQATETNLPEHSQEEICVDLLQTGLALAKGRDDRQFYAQELANTDDLLYTGSIVLGGQKLEAVMDTGSYDVEVFSKGCQGCGAAGARGFEPELSDTFRQGKVQEVMQFGSGLVTCIDAFDTLRIGPLEVDRQPLWEVIKADMDILSSATFQVILGLGPPSTTQVLAAHEEKSVKALESELEAISSPTSGRLQDRLDLVIPALERLQKLESSVPANLRVRFLSICLERAKGAKGHLYWNDLNPIAKPEHFRRLAPVGKLDWSVPLKDVKLTMADGQSWNVACKDACRALLDSGTSLLATHSHPILKIFQVLDALNANCNKLDELPVLEFDLGGVHHVLPPDVYLGFETGVIPARALKNFGKRPFVRVRQCSLLLIDLGDSFPQDFWILGMPFFRYYYTTFDFGRGGSDFYNDSLKRSIWTAPADAECQQQKAAETELRSASGALQLMRHLSPRRVNLANLRVPTRLKHWANGSSFNASF